MTHLILRTAPDACLSPASLDLLARASRKTAVPLLIANTVEGGFEAGGFAWWWECVDGELLCCANVQPRVWNMLDVGYANHCALAMRVGTIAGQRVAISVASVIVCRMETGNLHPQACALPPGSGLGVLERVRTVGERRRAVRGYVARAAGVGIGGGDGGTHEVDAGFAAEQAREIAGLAAQGQRHACAWVGEWAHG